MTTDGQAPTKNADVKLLPGERRAANGVIDRVRLAFGLTAGQLAALLVSKGAITQEQAARALSLQPGERLAANGVIIGSGAARDIPRFGADSNDFDFPAED
jgi:hypothetical protein